MVLDGLHLCLVIQCNNFKLSSMEVQSVDDLSSLLEKEKERGGGGDGFPHKEKVKGFKYDKGSFM